MWINLSNDCLILNKLILSNTCRSLLSKKVFEKVILWLTIIFIWSILFEIKKIYGCKIVIRWTDENVCVFLTLTKSMSETKLG